MMSMSHLAAAKALQALRDVQINMRNKCDLTTAQARRYRQIQALAKSQGMKYAMEYIAWEVAGAIEALEQEYPNLKDLS